MEINHSTFYDENRGVKPPNTTSIKVYDEDGQRVLVGRAMVVELAPRRVGILVYFPTLERSTAEYIVSELEHELTDKDVSETLRKALGD